VAVRAGARSRDTRQPNALLNNVVDARQGGWLGKPEPGQFLPVELSGRVVLPAPEVFGLGLLPEAPDLFLLEWFKVLRVDKPPNEVPETWRQAVGLGGGLMAILMQAPMPKGNGEGHAVTTQQIPLWLRRWSKNQEKNLLGWILRVIFSLWLGKPPFAISSSTKKRLIHTTSQWEWAR
jgi:hypothetical protein